MKWKDMVEPHGEESRIEWLISCVRWKETAAHPMSWLAVTFTTQEINSLRLRPADMFLLLILNEVRIGWAKSKLISCSGPATKWISS